MKILIVTPAVGLIYGGPSKIVLELAQGLGDLGISVDIVTTNANGSTNLDVPLFTWLSEKSYRVKYFPHWGVRDYKISLSLSSWLFQHVSDYDLVHTSALFSYPVLSAHWACRLHQVPYIVTPHGMLEPWALSYKAWKKRLYYTLLEKPALRRAKAIQITGSPEVNSVKSLGIETPLIFVPNGIHHQDFETLPDLESFYQKFPNTRNKTLILFLGRVDPKKGLDLLSIAFAKVHSQFPQTHLIVAGPDNIGFLPTAQGYLAEAGCLNAVTFTGMLTGSVKYAALAATSVYVAPSYSEGFSMSVLEGMASGLPCVITTGCNFPEAAAAQAAYVVNTDADEIANALSQCLHNPEFARAMGSRARQLILEKYTWSRLASNLCEVYKAILKREPIPALHQLSSNIMKTTSTKYEYLYANSNPVHHHAYLISPLLEMLAHKMLSRQQKPRVLDLGCGNGSFSHLIAQQGYEVVGVEESESGYKSACLNFPNCHFIQASIYDLPYSELGNCFDIVISSEVIEHLLYPRELVRAAKKCLKSNGRLIITTPYHGYLKNLVLAPSGKMDEHFNPLWDGGHVKFFSEATLTTLLQLEGYANISFKFTGRLPYLWKSMLCSSSPV